MATIMAIPTHIRKIVISFVVSNAEPESGSGDGAVVTLKVLFELTMVMDIVCIVIVTLLPLLQSPLLHPGPTNHIVPLIQFQH
mmetsp:Transcript_17692/g.22545  ORF Transcript_17692/g.22545 Transcript_17692/m.22545 type:complete len:83 (+) Transcript_17692:618-866(+)